MLQSWLQTVLYSQITLQAGNEQEGEEGNKIP